MPELHNTNYANTNYAQDEQQIQLLMQQMREKDEAEERARAHRDAAREVFDKEEYARRRAAEEILKYEEARQRQALLAASRRMSPTKRTMLALGMVMALLSTGYLGIQIGMRMQQPVAMLPSVTTTAPIATTGMLSPAQIEILTAEVKNFVETQDNVEIRARETLDEGPLAYVNSGEALRWEQGVVQQLRAQGHYSVNRLNNRTWQDISIAPNGVDATVSMMENWTTNVYSSATNELVSQNTLDNPQVLQMHKGINGWVCTSIDFQR